MQIRHEATLEAVLNRLRMLRDCGASCLPEKARLATEIIDACSGFDVDSSASALQDDHVVELLGFGRKFFTQWEVYLENLYNPSNGGLDRSNADTLDMRERYVEFYRSLVKAEMSLCRPAKDTRVCHVGCGALPVSLLMWHKYSGCTIMGVDFDVCALERARLAFADRAKADGVGYDSARVTFELAEGESLSYDSIDVVLLSTSVRGKAGVLERIVRTGAENIVVIERLPRLFWRHLTSWEEYRSESLAIRDVVKIGVVESRRLTAI